jgi:hypothetical protein
MSLWNYKGMMVGNRVSVSSGITKRPLFDQFTIAEITEYTVIHNGRFGEKFKNSRRLKMAERVGFEPTVPLGYNGFRDRHNKPSSATSPENPADETSDQLICSFDLSNDKNELVFYHELLKDSGKD